eukprot:1002028-Pelagomonas_calceolata.AAC.4
MSQLLTCSFSLSPHNCISPPWSHTNTHSTNTCTHSDESRTQHHSPGSYRLFAHMLLPRCSPGPSILWDIRSAGSALEAIVRKRGSLAGCS